MELVDIDIKSSAELPVDQWATFADFRRIGLYSNNCIFIDPEECQFYVDSDSGLLFVRKTTGKPKELLSDKELEDGYVKVTIDGTDYEIKILAGGVDDSDIGIWHDVFAIDNITGFYK